MEISEKNMHTDVGVQRVNCIIEHGSLRGFILVIIYFGDNTIRLL